MAFGLLLSRSLKLHFLRRQTLPVAELHDLQHEWFLGEDILRRGIRWRSAAEIRCHRWQTAFGIISPILGVSDAQAGESRPLRGKREGIERAICHRGCLERSSQIHR